MSWHPFLAYPKIQNIWLKDENQNHRVLIESVSLPLEMWIRKIATHAIFDKVNVTDGVFQPYSETYMFRICKAASEVVGKNKDDLMYLFGECFVNQMTQKGYRDILRVCNAYLP